MTIRAMAGVASLLLMGLSPSAQQRSIDAFFDASTAEWMRGNPNQATATRYFSGEEQDRLDRELSPVSREWQRGRIAVARKGLAELRAFQREELTPAQALSVEVMEWQLDVIIEGEKYLDYFFPFEQFNGVHIGLVSSLTVAHPIDSETDALNYLAKLRQFNARADEALADARRLAVSRMIPPRFILRTTLAQLRQFVETPPSANPFVSTLAERLAAVATMPPARAPNSSARANASSRPSCIPRGSE